MNQPVPRSRQARSRTGGFAMLEALVGLLIFSIGILGLVGVQVSMTKAQTNSKFRADAAALAGELVGSMWSDLPRIPNYDGTSCSGYAPCKAWSDKVAATLPQGTPTVAVNNGIVTITITWTLPSETVPARYVTATAIRG
jgi:type IV pilus assembly protein PilV